MNLYGIVFGLIFLVVGITFFIGKAPNWIKSWREMSEEEKSLVDIKLLCRNAGCAFLSSSIILLVSGFNESFKETAFIWCMITWLVATGLDVVFIRKSKRYKK